MSSAVLMLVSPSNTAGAHDAVKSSAVLKQLILVVSESLFECPHFVLRWDETECVLMIVSPGKQNLST